MNGTALIERAVALWNDQDRDGFIACFAEDCEFNVPRRPGTGRDAVATWWDIQATAFGPGNVQAKTLVESGDTVVLEAVYEATHSGPLTVIGRPEEIPATGKTMMLPYVAVYTVRNQLILSARNYWDTLDALGQLGLTPT